MSRRRVRTRIVDIAELLAIDPELARSDAHWCGQGYARCRAQVWRRRDGMTARIVWRKRDAVVSTVTYTVRTV